MPVKLSDDLVEEARREAKAADRSITAQIEHWAKLGRSVESALRHDDLLALKRGGADPQTAFPHPTTRRAILDTLRSIARGEYRPQLATSLTAGRTVYQSDPLNRGMVERIEPNGVRTVGRFENRRFVPDESPRRTRRR